MGQTIIDVDDNLRLVGTAHVSSASVTLVREQIDEYGPDLVAVELCESRLKSLKRPDDLANSDLLNIINEGRSSMILLQSALAAQQRRMGIETGEKPGAELLAAIEAADAAEIPHELIDRDVVITLRRAWRKMGLREKWRVLNALLWDEDDDEVVDFDDTNSVVPYGGTGRVKLTTLTKETFVPGFLERDEGERELPYVKYPWDGISGVRPFSKLATATTVGVY